MVAEIVAADGDPDVEGSLYAQLEAMTPGPAGG